jgi:hypothetical protein
MSGPPRCLADRSNVSPWLPQINETGRREILAFLDVLPVEDAFPVSGVERANGNSRLDASASPGRDEGKKAANPDSA